MATQIDPHVALDNVGTALRDAQQRASVAEAEAAEAKKVADALAKEKDEHWKTQIKEVKKLHPGSVKLLKMLIASTREELEEMRSFLNTFDGHLPLGLVRVAQGVEALLDGVDAKGDKK